MGPFNRFLCILRQRGRGLVYDTMGEILLFARFPMTNYYKILRLTKGTTTVVPCIHIHGRSLVGLVPVIRNMLFGHSLLSARSVYGNIIRERQFIIIQRLLFFFFFYQKHDKTRCGGHREQGSPQMIGDGTNGKRW